MERFELSVSTSFSASMEAVWAHKTEPLALAGELAPLMLRCDEVSALRDAIRGGPRRTFAARLGGPIGLLSVSWPIEIRGSTPYVEFEDGSQNRLVSEFSHKHRFERDGEHIRYTDHVVFRPALRPRRLVAAIFRDAFVKRHHVAATALPAVPDSVGRASLRRVP